MTKRIIEALRQGARRALAAVILCCLPLLANAAWDLDKDRSTVQFMSVKNASVAELHHFKALAGGVTDAGAARVVIDLDSVETLVPIRNQRMRELLFETVRFPAANLTAQIPGSLADIAAGETRSLNLEVSVELHGNSASYPAKVSVTGLADGALQVVLREPIMVQAADFELAAGIEVLREVAGLKTISTAVPVTAQLVFTAAS
jgi:hypothetical protein